MSFIVVVRRELRTLPEMFTSLKLMSLGEFKALTMQSNHNEIDKVPHSLSALQCSIARISEINDTVKHNLNYDEQKRG